MKGPNPDPKTLSEVNSVVANLHSFRGEMAETIAFREAALQVAQKTAPTQVPLLIEGLGVAYLHRAGMTLYDKFFFPHPLDPAQISAKDKADLDKAATYFPSGIFSYRPIALDVRWPAERNLWYVVWPVSQRSAAEAVSSDSPGYGSASKENPVHFTDVAGAAGLNRRGMAGGVIVDDFDNDGLFDIVISSQDDCVPLRYFHNNGDGSFTDRAMQAGLGDQTGGLNIIQTDYNNDGCKDILILRGGWEWARRKSLLRNNCNGTFTDVTRESGLLDPARATQTAVWTDIDNDARL